MSDDIPKPIVPHDVVWSPEQVSRFWDFCSVQNADSYFAKMVGSSLIALVKSKIAIGTALDIGCGTGDLIGKLMAQEHDAYGVDSSAASIDKVNSRFTGSPRFKGAAFNRGKIELPDEIADTAFLIEVVEHMDDTALNASLTEAWRVLKPGGHLVLTTPNNEDLDASKVMCPECGGVFHRIQHIRSWTANTLADHVRQLGFEPLMVEGTILSPYNGLKGWLYKLTYLLVRGRRPHLVYIGKKV